MSGDSSDSEAILAEQMRALRRLRSSIEHELRSGLNSVVLNVELLSSQIERLEALDDPDVETEAEALRDMVTGLREGASALTRRIEMTMRTILPADPIGGPPSDLAEMVRNLGVFLAFEARLLRAQCDVQVPPLQIPISGRRSLVQSILSSLGVEALRLTVPDGVIRLVVDSGEEVGETARVEISVAPYQAVDGGEGAAQGVGLMAMCAALGAGYEREMTGEAARLRLRLPRRDTVGIG